MDLRGIKTAYTNPKFNLNLKDQVLAAKALYNAFAKEPKNRCQPRSTNASYTILTAFLQWCFTRTSKTAISHAQYFYTVISIENLELKQEVFPLKAGIPIMLITLAGIVFIVGFIFLQRKSIMQMSH